jgi:hypothetical protein
MGQHSPELSRLLRAITTVLDRHIEDVQLSRDGTRLLYLPMLPHDLKELRSAVEPFRASREHASESYNEVIKDG